MKSPLARLVAAVGLAALFTTSAFAQVAPSNVKPTSTATTTVKSHVRHMKSGKTVLVHGYTRTKPGMKMAPKMTHVKGYTTKTGKVVKGYNRKASMKKTGMKKMGMKKMGMKKMAPMMKKP